MNKNLEQNESMKMFCEKPNLVNFADLLINHYGEEQVKKALEKKIKK